VDVFFVISGYLITRLIHDEMSAGRFSVARFYERRIRRIFPALFAVLAASTVAAAFWFMPIDFDAFSDSLAGAALSVSNFVFWREAGYFAGPSDLKPLLHTWSLGVEEQFYVVFPLVLLALHRYARRFLPAVLAAVVVASFALSVWGTRHHTGAAFYLLPFRAWELGLGALLAVGVVPALKRRVAAELLAMAGLLLILVPVFTYTPETRFPGWAALPPTLGAALLIYAAPQAASIGGMLRLRPLVFIGLLSYSLYLWHWPLIVFTRYRMPADLDFATSCTLVSASVVAAYASWRWIEQPFRRARTPGHRRAVFTAGGCAVAATVAVALWTGSWLPLMLVGLPRLYGSWHMVLTGLLQHIGLADNVTDHRLNTRTVYMNPISRWIYWNMNYHVEHHMFPMVPYHALPRLHELIKHDLPEPNPSMWHAYREVWPVLLKQLRYEDYFLKRELPPTAKPYRGEFHDLVIPAAAE